MFCLLGNYYLVMGIVILRIISFYWTNGNNKLLQRLTYTSVTKVRTTNIFVHFLFVYVRTASHSLVKASYEIGKITISFRTIS